MNEILAMILIVFATERIPSSKKYLDIKQPGESAAEIYAFE
jgi:hypothetical protein